MTSSLSSHELAALERLARALPSEAGAAPGGRARLVAGRGFDLLGLDPWREGVDADARRLDVAARVRTGAWWVRTFHDEADARIHVAVDESRSLDDAKLASARRLADALVFVAGVRLQRWTRHVLARDASTPLVDWFRTLARAVGRTERLVILTDLADPTPPRDLLAPLAALARIARVDVCQLRAPGDAALPAGARALRSPEGRGERATSGDARDFAARLEAWRREIAETAARLGLRFSSRAEEALVATVERIWS